MIKFVLAAVWICAATVGAVTFSYQASQARQGAAPPAPFFGGLDYVKTHIISVPVVRDGTIGGYFLTRLVYTVKPGDLQKLTIPAEVLFIDQVYAYLFGNPQIDWSEKESIDLDAFKAGIRDSINERVGMPLIHEVLIEQADYLSKAEIRENAYRRRLVPEEEAEEPQEQAKTEH